jgi:hypothetical protein
VQPYADLAALDVVAVVVAKPTAPPGQQVNVQGGG